MGCLSFPTCHPPPPPAMECGMQGGIFSSGGFAAAPGISHPASPSPVSLRLATSRMCVCSPPSSFLLGVGDAAGTVGEVSRPGSGPAIHPSSSAAAA